MGGILFICNQLVLLWLCAAHRVAHTQNSLRTKHSRDQLLPSVLFHSICYFSPKQEGIGIALSFIPGGLRISNIVLVSSLDFKTKNNNLNHSTPFLIDKVFTLFYLASCWHSDLVQKSFPLQLNWVSRKKKTHCF